MCIHYKETVNLRDSIHKHALAIHNSCTTMSIHHKDPVKVRGSEYTFTHITHVYPKDPVKVRGSKYTHTHTFAIHVHNTLLP